MNNGIICIIKIKCVQEKVNSKNYLEKGYFIKLVEFL